MRIDPNISSAENPVDRATVGGTPSSQNRVQDTPSLTSAPEVDAAFGKVNSLKAELECVPDIRQELVKSLQQRIQQGSYDVSNQQIADAMIKDLGMPGK